MHRIKTIINDPSRRAATDTYELDRYNSSTSMMNPVMVNIGRGINFTNQESVNHRINDYYHDVNLRYDKICKVIDSIPIEDLPSVRDLLYRMNAIDPVERENMNRGFKPIDYYDAPHNYCSAYMSIGRDDTTIHSLMNHEISALMILLLRRNNMSLTVDYNIHRLFLLCYRIAKYCDNTYRASRFKRRYIAPPTYQPSLRYLLLQSMIDEHYHIRMKYKYRFDRGRIDQLCKKHHSKNGAFGTIKINDSASHSMSLESFIVSNYIGAIYGKDELSYNLNQYLMFNPHRLINTKYAYLSEEFRRVLHNTTIVIQQMIMFSFIDYIDSMIDKDDGKHVLFNSIDERMFTDRKFQHTILLVNERYNIDQLFRDHIKRLVVSSSDR